MRGHVIRRGALLAAIAACLILLPIAFPGKTAVVVDAPGEQAPTSSAKATPNRRPVSSPTRNVPPDVERPTAVTDLRLAGNNATTFTLVWAESTDNVGVVDYAVSLDGHLIGYINETTVTLMWPGGSAEFHVEIAARDANGNWSEWRKVVIVPPPPAVQRVPQRTFRPQPPPSPIATPTPSPETSPPATPVETATPTPTPNPTPAETQTPTPSVTPTPTAEPSEPSTSPTPTEAPSPTETAEPTSTPLQTPENTAPSETPKQVA